MGAKIQIKNLALGELKEALVQMGEPPFRAVQIFEWIYAKGINSFDLMSNISKSSREKLKESFEICGLEGKEFYSKDGTIKFLFKLTDGLSIESVLIPMAEKSTLCISSQVGCALGCAFCLTGKIGFKRNLETWELLEQVLYVQRYLADTKRISNVVLMGMGEPLLNYENVVKALDIMKSKDGLGFSKKKITLSTAGITPMVIKLAKDCQVKLAVSLNASSDLKRSALMPINKKYPIEDLLKVLAKYHANRRERFTFEYVMMDGVNDKDEDVRQLARILKNLPAKVNLIPFNECKELKYKRSTDINVDRFKKMLEEEGITATVRKSKGLDINGACGQLVGNLAKR